MSTNKNKLMMVIALLLTAASAFAEKVGNGGGAHYCPNPTATQKKIEAYDLWLGRKKIGATTGLSIPEYNGISTKAVYLKNAISQIRSRDPVFADAIQKALSVLNANRIDSQGLELEVVKDALALYHEKGCQYYQLVNWIDDPIELKIRNWSKEQVLRDESAYQELDPQSQAANDLHEAVYKVLRLGRIDYYLNIAGSFDVQRFVAEAFSDEGLSDETFFKVSPFGPLVKQDEAFYAPGGYTDGETTTYELKSGVLNCDDEVLKSSFSAEIKNASDETVSVTQKPIKPGETRNLTGFSALRGDPAHNDKYTRAAALDVSPGLYEVSVKACGRVFKREMFFGLSGKDKFLNLYLTVVNVKI